MSEVIVIREECMARKVVRRGPYLMTVEWGERDGESFETIRIDHEDPRWGCVLAEHASVVRELVPLLMLGLRQAKKDAVGIAEGPDA